MLDNLKAMLYASKVCSYAQGLIFTNGYSDHLGQKDNFYKCAHMWRGGGGGCIICETLISLLLAIAQVRKRRK